MSMILIQEPQNIIQQILGFIMIPLDFNINLLAILLLLPLIGFILNGLVPKKYTIDVTLTIFILNFILVLLITYLQINGWGWLNSSLFITLWKTFYFKLDGLSVVYILLTSIIMLVCLTLLESIKNEYVKYLQSMMAMLFLLNLVFTAQDLFAFYISFEAMVIPMFILIGTWGSRNEKVKAAYYFIVYTIGGSITLLLGILKLNELTGTTSLLILNHLNLPTSLEYFLFIGFFLSFAAKIPLIPFHIWLPLAHVEAPVAGSVLLAGLLIKLGTYGFIRFALPITPNACVDFAPLIIMLCIISIIYASLSTIRQTDLKRIIAYSSVAHMGVATLSIFSLTKIGISASVFLQLAHGVVSSGLFILVTILYNHHHTRAIPYYRGVALTMPIFSTLFVFFNLCNIGMPLTGNFIGEFLALLAGFNYSPWVGILGGIGVVLSACYALFLVSRVCYGEASKHLIYPRDLNIIEFIILFTFLILILYMGIFPNTILDLINSGINENLNLNKFKF